MKMRTSNPISMEEIDAGAFLEDDEVELEDAVQTPRNDLEYEEIVVFQVRMMLLHITIIMLKKSFGVRSYSLNYCLQGVLT